MALRIDKTCAAALLRAAADEVASPPLDPWWVESVEHLSQLCEEGISKTHLAFLGTAMIAKAMHTNADLFAIKPKSAGANPNAFSARTLCHSVLVPLAAELGINIGVTGREPLNNQPYFRMNRLDDGTPVHSGGRMAFDYMVDLVRKLQSLSTEAEAREALRAFIAVRRRYQPRYTNHDSSFATTPAGLVLAIRGLVQDNSEHGRRAQAVVAGLMDAFAGPERVESGRINDPSRHYPGDVCVRGSSALNVWEKAIEVRDKPVAASDVQIFGKKCVDMGVREAALVMVCDSQESIDSDAIGQWAAAFGIGITLFQGWENFVDQALFWSGDPKPVAAIRAVGFIHDRLIAVEASPEAVALWARLTRPEEAFLIPPDR
jgi:hypothetical protein